MVESFSAKIKPFRANLREVADKTFFLFHIAAVCLNFSYSTYAISMGSV